MSEAAITKLTVLSQVATSAEVGPTSNRQDVSATGNVSPQQEETEVTREEVAEAVSNVTNFIQSVSRELQFQVDDTTGGTIVTVMDSETDEIVRQIPTEEIVAISRYIAEFAPDPVKGLLMNSES